VAGNRVTVQAVSSSPGLPDQVAVDQYLGLPGSQATPRLGSDVLVSFLEGDVRYPVLDGYLGQHGSANAPIEIGSGQLSGAARQGDSVEVLIPPAVFTGTINGQPATGVVTWALPKAIGTITGGSAETKIGSGV
jgi:hypothetical protein